MTTYNEVLDYWFPNGDKYEEFWFNHSKDSEITLKFSDILTELEKQTEVFTEWMSSSYSKLACIIVLDQFSRNIYRNDRPTYTKNDIVTMTISNQMIENDYDRDFPLSHRLFILMPYRHLSASENDSKYIDFVLEKLNAYELEIGSSPLLTRFRNATYASYTSLTDRIYKYLYDNSNDKLEKYDNVLNGVYKTYGKDEDGQENDAGKSILVKNLTVFVKRHNIRKVGVSLSGGVDSMSLLFCLKFLEMLKVIDHVYALHLEYSNRSESRDETNLIGLYCSCIQVPLYTRTIDYMSRDKVDRNFYEQETKSVRFATYRHLSEKLMIDGWCLGHISNDISENVFMNMCAGRDLTDLSVMEKVNLIYDVTLYRPFLDITKNDIYKFAHSFAIPYLKDSTPDWSIRGVLRRKILPALESQWPSIDQAFINIGEQSKQWRSVIDAFILEPIKKEIVFKGHEPGSAGSCHTVEIPIKDDYIYLPQVIWANIFLFVFHSIGVRMISHKNISYFMETLKNNVEKKNQFRFSNHCVGIFLARSEMVLRIINLKPKK